MKTLFGRRFLLVAAFLAALTLPLSAGWAQSNDRPALKEMLTAVHSQVDAISIADAKALFDGGALFVDVRTQAEWAAGHLPGAKHLDRNTLEFNVEQNVPDKATPIVVYCKSGDRGALATQSLLGMGYTNVVNMTGGYVAWQKAGFATAQ